MNKILVNFHNFTRVFLLNMTIRKIKNKVYSLLSGTSYSLNAVKQCFIGIYFI